jgi:hypothetical protein
MVGVVVVVAERNRVVKVLTCFLFNKISSFKSFGVLEFFFDIVCFEMILRKACWFRYGVRADRQPE